ELTTPSYLFGTIHLIGKKDFFIPKGTKSRFESCEVLAMEIDMDNPMEILKMAMSGMIGGKSLEKRMDSADFQRLKSFMLDTLQVSNTEFELAMKMQPMLASSLMYPKMIEGETVAYEERFLKEAKKRDMEVVGLESVSDQMDAISGIPMDVQIEMLMAYVDSFEVQKAMFNELVDIYRAQDLPKLSTLLDDTEDLGEFEDVMLTNRNRSWIPKIEKLAKEQPTFFAVGAGHLWGEEGVIQLLQAEGYEVTPVRFFKAEEKQTTED
ncbi:MAG: TraB/GumN family protein, partial [Bacteroidota bacterium]